MKNKNYDLKVTIPCESVLLKQIANAGPQPLVCLGLDVELVGAAGSIVVGGGTPFNLSKHPRATWIALASWLVERGCRVHVVQEACGFGWAFHRSLEAAKAISIVVAPTNLSGKRKTDKRDAKELAMALWDRAQHGNTKVLNAVRIPSEQELRDRDFGRLRSQLRAQRNRLDLQVRSLMRNHDYLIVPEMWWQARRWAKLKIALLEQSSEWLIEMITPLQAMLIAIQKQMDELEVKLIGTLKTKNLKGQTPKGLGELTRALFAAEMMDCRRSAMAMQSPTGSSASSSLWPLQRPSVGPGSPIAGNLVR